MATRELSDHINDQYDALRENGLNQKEAMRKAIEEMGDADVVGTELDIVHRPKVNWLLLLIAGVLLLSGILISAMLTSISLTVPKIIGIVLGVCVAAFLYFIDYTVLIRFPRALYGLLSLAAIFGLLYELWNGFAPLGYGKPYQAAPYRQPKAENRHRRPFAGVYGFSQLRRDKSRRYNGKGT